MANEDGARENPRDDDDADMRAGRLLAVLAGAVMIAGLLMGLMALALSASSRTAQNPLDLDRLEQQSVGHLAVPRPDDGGE
ncbi:MAG: hypothetical protein KC619_01455 [Myxococcales bacterium]|nr:hypothetical protein [Myxococcales bacterium]